MTRPLSLPAADVGQNGEKEQNQKVLAIRSIAALLVDGVSLGQVAFEAELTLSEFGGHVANLRDLATRNKRPLEEWNRQRDRLPAKRTLARLAKWAAEHEDELRRLLAEGLP